MKIFYSWQTTTKAKYNRYFIEECLEKAIVKSSLGSIKLYSVDRDTKDILGTPDIVDVIFDKIRNSRVFVADVSLCVINSNRGYPNSNVLVELGFAAAVLGWENIICVFNTALGRVEDLPFDIRKRRICPYFYDESIPPSEARSKLIDVFCMTLEDMSVEKRRFLETFHSCYHEEPEYLKRIYLGKGKYWEFELIGKLLDDRFDRIVNRVKDLKEGVLVVRKNLLNGRDTFKITTDLFGRISSTIPAVSKIINQKLMESLGPYGESGDPILMKRVADLLHEALKELLEMEVELHTISTNNKVAHQIKEKMKGWAMEFIDQLLIIPREFEKIYLGHYEDGTDIELTINLEKFQSVEDINAIINTVNNNIYLILEEEDDYIH